MICVSQAAFPEAVPHVSYAQLPMCNGFSPAVYNIDANRVDAYYDHLYHDYDGMTPSTDLCWDTYWGLNVDSAAAWLCEIDESEVMYEEGTGIVHVVRTFEEMRVDEYYFSPFDFDGSAVVMLAQVTHTGSAPARVSLYALHNFHVGPGAPEAGFGSEAVNWSGGQFSEAGAGTGRTFIYRPLVLPSHRRTDFAASPGNPYFHIGDPALVDNDSTGGPVDDAVVAFQWHLGSGGFFNPGESRWHGVLIVYASNPDLAALTDTVILWTGGRDVETVLNDERLSWQGWLSAGGVIDSRITDADRLRQARQSLVMMRMGQVREENSGYGAPHGQIVASMPPGMWNITWPRDQAYAAAGLAEAGYFEEARWSFEFVLNGQAGNYAAEVGAADYLVSVCRYYGGGFEESDGDPAFEGPNIEFDNFGLFLWSLGKYVEKSGDYDFASLHRDAIFGGVADVLVQLIEPSTGLLAPDSSIWERHWNGSQEHFAYSDIMAVRGLCSAAGLAENLGLHGDAAGYMLAAREIHAGIVDNLVVDSENFIAQSFEEIGAGAYVDAAVVEALNFDLFSPDDPVFDTVLGRFRDELWIGSTDRGYKRNDDGDWYDEQEWVVMDLRIALASRAGGDETHFDALVDWVTGQSQRNYGLIAELYDNINADYEGAVPMMGFGGGAYLLALLADPGEESVRGCLEGPLPSEEPSEVTVDGENDIVVDEIMPEPADEDIPEAEADLTGEDAGPDAVDEGDNGSSNGGCGCNVAA